MRLFRGSLHFGFFSMFAFARAPTPVPFSGQTPSLQSICGCIPSQETCSTEIKNVSGWLCIFCSLRMRSGGLPFGHSSDGREV